MTRRFYPPTESDIPMHGWRPYSDVHIERVRAHAKHDADGLVEEVGEVARVLCEMRPHQHLGRDEARGRLREELVQVAAMAVAWIDAIDLEQS